MLDLPTSKPFHRVRTGIALLLCFEGLSSLGGCTGGSGRPLDLANSASQVLATSASGGAGPSSCPSGFPPITASAQASTASASTPIAPSASAPTPHASLSSAPPDPSFLGSGTPDAGATPSGTAASSLANDAGPPDDDLCQVGVYDGTPPKVLELSGDTFAHDPTMIEANGVFYRFWTGNNLPMAIATGLTQWTDGPNVYSNGYPAWVTDWRAANPGNTFNFPWAPDVSYFGGQYHLYASFSAFFGRNVSCINHLTTADIAAGNWVDHGSVICTDGSEDYNAIDPDVGIDATGQAWLAFGSFWDGIQAFPLDASGNRAGNSLTQLAWASEIEAPVLFRRCGYHYLFVSFGLCCPGEGRNVEDLSYRVVVGRSENILGPYLDRDGMPLLDGGGTPVVAGDGVNFAAAGHSDVLVSGKKIYHLYHAYRQSDGNATLRIAEMPFDDEGWPVPGGP